jgi:hypothetical protein
MAQTAGTPDPGTVDTRGVGTTASVDKNQRKTGYRPDAQITATENALDPNSLIRVVNDPRLT